MVGHRGQGRRDDGLGPDEGRRTFQVNSFVRVGVGYRSAAFSFPKVSQDVPGVY